MKLPKYDIDSIRDDLEVSFLLIVFVISLYGVNA